MKTQASIPVVISAFISAIAALSILSTSFMNHAVAQETANSATSSTNSSDENSESAPGRETFESLIAKIESSEIELYDLFNQLNSSDEYDIVCKSPQNENVDFTSQLCEPVFFEKIRDENRLEIQNGAMNNVGFFGKLRESFFGPWELSEEEIRKRAAEPIRQVLLEFETLASTNPALLARLQNVGELQAELRELAEKWTRNDPYLMQQNDPSYNPSMVQDRPGSSMPWFSAPPPGHTTPTINFGHPTSANRNR